MDIMRIEKRYSELKRSELKSILYDYKKYDNFNPYGFCLGIIESEILYEDGRIHLRDFFKELFPKEYEWFRLKDVNLYTELETLGMDLTDIQKRDYFWNNLESKSNTYRDTNLREGGYAKGYGDSSYHVQNRKYKGEGSTQGQNSKRVKQSRKTNWKRKWEDSDEDDSNLI